MEDIEKVYSEYANLIKKYIFCITKDMNLAEDVMQETFVVAIKQIKNFRGDCDIFVWLCSIAKKILYKKTKKEGNDFEIPIEELNIKDDKLIEDDFLNKEEKLKVFEKLQKLDAVTREVIYLRLSGDFTFKEIAKILHKTESWAKVTFFRGKQKLREEILNERN